MKKLILYPLLFLFLIVLVSGEDGKKADKTIPLKKELTEKSAASPVIPKIKPRLNTSFWKQPAVVYKYNEPADLIELVPILRDINQFIPRNFSLAEHQFILSPNQMTVQHQFLDERTKRTPKNSFISFTYDEAFGNYNTNVEVPLFYSPIVGLSGMRLSDWSRYPLGNYTMKIWRNEMYNNDNRLYIKAQTKF